jgi:hypothetical protein
LQNSPDVKNVTLTLKVLAYDQAGNVGETSMIVNKK